MENLNIALLGCQEGRSRSDIGQHHGGHQCRGCRSDTRQRQGDEGGETEIKNTLFIFLQNSINDEKRN